jgi:hypothetical protein
VGGQSELFEIVAALNARRGLSDLLDGWQQQADQNADDRNHHQQLDERETTPSTRDTREWHKASEKEKKRRRVSLIQPGGGGAPSAIPLGGRRESFGKESRPAAVLPYMCLKRASMHCVQMLHFLVPELL